MLFLPWVTKIIYWCPIPGSLYHCVWRPLVKATTCLWGRAGDIPLWSNLSFKSGLRKGETTHSKDTGFFFFLELFTTKTSCIVNNDNVLFDLLDKNQNRVALRLFLWLIVKIILDLFRTMTTNHDFAIYLNYVDLNVHLIKEGCAPHRYHLIIILLDAIWCWN